MFVLCITRKLKALTCFQQVLKTISQDTGRTISTLCTDCGGEFSSIGFLVNISENNICSKLTTTYTPQHNTVVERANQTIMEGVHGPLYHLQLPMSC